jgi:hypothetical protein
MLAIKARLPANDVPLLFESTNGGDTIERRFEPA